MQPHGFNRKYVVAAEMPYCCRRSNHPGTPPEEGVLQRGRVLWLEDGNADARIQCAYVEGLGYLWLDAHQRSLLREQESFAHQPIADLDGFHPAKSGTSTGAYRSRMSPGR